MARRSRGVLSMAAGGPNVLSFLAVALLITAGVYFLWSRFGGPGDRYLSLQSIEVKHVAAANEQDPPTLAERAALEQPAWILGDVKAEVFRDASLEKVSIRDPNAVKLVGEAFQAHTWVARVELVNKRYPDSMYIALEYRTPTALVEVDHEQVAKLQPVDANGYVLPTDFLAKAPETIPNFLRVLVDRQMPAGAEGRRWGDPRVENAARIANLIRDIWQELKVYRIRAIDGAADSSTNYVLTDAAEQNLILWGSAPGKEISGEATPEIKLAHLKSLYEQYGPMTALTAIADLRDPQQVRFPQRTAGNPVSAPVQ